MTHYLFNVVGDEDRALGGLRSGRWVVDAGERHRSALAAGDLVLIYVGAPARVFVGRAELASAVREPAGDVLLTAVQEWDPPVPMADVLPRIDTSQGARADFDTGVLRITETEYATAVAVAQGR